MKSVYRFSQCMKNGVITLKFNIKNILHKYVYRSVPVVVTFVIVLSCFLIPVSAITVDYYDTDFVSLAYKKETRNGIYYYYLDAFDDWMRHDMKVYENGVITMNHTSWDTGDLYTAVLSKGANNYLSLRFDPFYYRRETSASLTEYFGGFEIGSNQNEYTVLYTGDTVTFDFSFTVTTDPDSTWFFPYCQIWLNYFNDQGTLISQQKLDVGKNYDYIVGGNSARINKTIIMQVPDGCMMMTPHINLQNLYIINPAGDYIVDLKIDNFDLIIGDDPLNKPSSGSGSGSTPNPDIPSGESGVIIDQNNIIIDQNDVIIDQNNDLINGTPQQNEQVGSAVGGMESAGDKLGSLNDQMQVEKPDIDSFDVSIDSLVPYDTLLAYTAPFTNLWESNTLLGMLMIVLTLVLVSWVMFGKKG